MSAALVIMASFKNKFVAHSNKQQNKGGMIAYSLQTILYAHKVSIPLHMKRSNFQVRLYNACFGDIFGYLNLYCGKLGSRINMKFLSQ